MQVPSVGCGIGPAATIGREEAAEAMAKRLSLIFIYFVGWCGILFCLESGGGGVDGGGRVGGGGGRVGGGRFAGRHCDTAD